MSVILRRFLCAAGLFPFVVAAHTAPTADTVCAYPRQLGLTASPQLAQFFTANRSLPVGLLYRQQTGPTRATRYRVGGRYEFNSADAPLLIGHAYREHTTSLEGAWGRERWLPLSRRVTAYAGGEVGARLDWYRKNSEYYRAILRYAPVYSPALETAVTDQVERRTPQTLFLQAFAGLRFYLSSRFCAEVETGLPVSFSHQKWNVDGVEVYVADRVPNGATVTGENTYYAVLVQYRPVSRLHVIFLF